MNFYTKITICINIENNGGVRAESSQTTPIEQVQTQSYSSQRKRVTHYTREYKES